MHPASDPRLVAEPDGQPAEPDAGAVDLEGSADPDVYRRRWYILAVLCLALLVIGLDGTIVNVALPSLVRDLGASQTQLEWILDAYTIVFAAMLLTAGTLGDRFGRRAALLVGLGIFAIGSATSARAGSPEVLIATRAVQGFGAAFIMPATLSILTNVFPASERGRAIGIWAGASGLAVAIGPLTGGWLLEHFWWGSIFLVNVPVIVAAMLAVIAIVPDSRNPARPRLDIPGTILSILGLTGVLFGIIEAPQRGWTDAVTLAGFVVGGLLLAAFVLWELHTEQPMLNMRFFRNPRFSAASIAITLVFFALFGTLSFVSQYLQFVLDYSPLESGVALLPVAVGLVIAAPLSSTLVTRFGTKAVVAAGLGFVAVGFALLTRVSTDSGFELVAVVLGISGLGMGLAMAPATDSILGSIPASEAGLGSAVNDTTRQVGGALGVAVLGSVLTSAYSSRIDSSVPLRRLAAVGGAEGTDALDAVKSSVGNASTVAERLAPLERIGAVPRGTGRAIVATADEAFVHGLDRTAVLGGIVVLVGVVVVVLFLPSRPRSARTGVAALDELATAGAQQLTEDRIDDTDTTTAALHLLSQSGMSSLAFNGIAAKSGISATARSEWDADLERVVEVARAASVHDAPDTGSLRGDLLLHLGRAAEQLRQPSARPVLVALLDATVERPDTAPTLRDTVLEPRRRAMRTILDRAIARGELSESVDTDLLAETLISPLYLRVLITGEAIDDELVAELIDAALAPAAVTPPRPDEEQR